MADAVERVIHLVPVKIAPGANNAKRVSGHFWQERLVADHVGFPVIVERYQSDRPALLVRQSGIWGALAVSGPLFKLRYGQQNSLLSPA